MGDGDSRLGDAEATSAVRLRRPEEGDARPTIPRLLATPAIPAPRPPMETPRELVVPAPPAGSHATLTAMSGLEAGRVYSLDADEVIIGRAPASHVWIDDASVSRKHARIVRRPGEPYVIEDLESTNGTFIGERRVSRCPLASGDRVQFGPTFLLRFALVDMREEALQKELFHAATRDMLSSLYNRRYFEERLLAEVSRARRTSSGLAILMIDLDQFKRVNDRYGHLVGDEVLRAVSGALARSVRLEDVLARYGGEEFVLLAPGISGGEAALLGERLRSAVERLSIQVDEATGGYLGISVSIGIASLTELEPQASPRELLARADARLYRAKQSGRNRVATAG
jgi:diguanylate cyclase (GGDEF)-like protein